MIALIRAPSPAPLVGLPRRSGLLASIALAAWVALGEISRLSGDLLDVRGRSWPFAALMGPQQLLGHSYDGWLALPTVADPRFLAQLLVIHLALDAVFIAAYLVLLLRLFRQRFPAAAVLAGVVAAVDVLEDVLAAVFASRLPARPPAPGTARVIASDPGWFSLEGALVVATVAKWIAVLLLVLAVLARLITGAGQPWRAALRRQLEALWLHRFMVLAVLPVAVLSVPPGPNLLDQLPDVQRGWIESVTGVWHGVSATFVLAILVVTVFAFGRLRSDRLWRAQFATGPVAPADLPARSGSTVLWWIEVAKVRPNLFLWLAGPAALAVLAVIVRLFGGPVAWWQLVAFCALPILVFVVSLVLRVRAATRVKPRSTEDGALAAPNGTARQLPLATALTVVRVGDGLTVLTVVLAGAGLIRSFTAPAVLYGPSTRKWAWLMLVIGTGAILGAWGLEKPVRRRLQQLALTADTPTNAISRVVRTLAQFLTPGLPAEGSPSLRARVVFLVLGAAVFLVLGALPVPLADGLGVLACAVLALTSVVTVVAVTVIITQSGQPPEVFRTRLRVTPVVTLLVLAVALANLAATSVDVHGVRGLSDRVSSQASRPFLVDASDLDPTAPFTAPMGGDAAPQEPSVFANWLAQSNPCERKASPSAGASGKPDVVLRPLLLVAAEGGGIRAAYWTAAGLDRIAAAGSARTKGCGSSATLVSSGASGGAVGLTVARFAAGQAAGQVRRMAGPGALGAASIGLFVRDVFRSATGVPLPSFGAPGTPRSWSWDDRAALMEHVWERESAGLTKGYLSGPPPPAGTGALVLNSTTVAAGCRAVVSQVRLTRDPPSAAAGSAIEDPPCKGVHGPLPFSLDLIRDYGPDRPSPASTAGTSCIGSMTAGTAAMLASRFPYVTPSGVLGPCPPYSRQQFVDGGYAENTGIGTLLDLAPAWLAAVQTTNEETVRVLTRTGPGHAGPLPFVVPILVYLDNGAGSDVSDPAQNATAEILVPPVTSSHAGASQSDAPALLQRAAQLLDPQFLCDEKVEACRSLLAVVESWPRVAVVAPDAAPEISAPLGWVLSAGSMNRMDAAMTDQATKGCAQVTNSLCSRGFARLKEVLDLLGG